MRPIDKKLKYQVDKVIQLAVTGGAGTIYSLIYFNHRFHSVLIPRYRVGRDYRNALCQSVRPLHFVSAL